MKGKKIRQVNKRRMNEIDIGHIIVILSIVIVGMCFIQNESSIKIVGDEFGYWSAAAWMAGYNWSDIVSINSYYSYGYGLLLLPILKLGISQVSKYQLALVFNILLLIATYVISYVFINRYKPELSNLIKKFIALISVFYVSNIYYAQYTLVEVLLCFLYWCSILLLYDLLQDFTILKVLLLEVIFVYMFVVHQRTIGNVLVGTFFLGYILIKKAENRKRNVLVGIVTFSILFILAFYIKNKFQVGYLNSFVSQDPNDFSVQMTKIKSMFTFDGMKLFIVGLIGKIYYACSASYLLGIAFFVYFVRKVRSLKDKREQKQREIFIYAYLLLSMIISMCVSCVFLLDYTKRFDTLIYGRYFEYTLIPLIILAMIELLEDKEHNLYFYGGMLLFYECLTVVIHCNIPYDTSRSHVFMNLSAFGDILNGDENVLLVNLKVIIILCVVVFLLAKGKKQKKRSVKFQIAAILFLLANWILTAAITSVSFNKWTSIGCSKEEELAEEILEMNIVDRLYFYDEDGSIVIDFLQFLLGNHTIHVIEGLEDVLTLPEDAYVLTVPSSSIFTEEFVGKYENISTSHYLKLWKRIEMM